MVLVPLPVETESFIFVKRGFRFRDDPLFHSFAAFVGISRDQVVEFTRQRNKNWTGVTLPPALSPTSNRLCAKVLTDSEAAISTRLQAARVIASFTEEEANKMIKWRTDLALDEDPDFFKVFSR